MHAWHDIRPAEHSPDRTVNAIIEIPAGSSSKYELHKDYGILKLDRVLFTSTHYPANYGFIPQTYADDDDPLDILVLCRKAMPPMTLMRAKVIGVFFMVDDEDIDEKILAVSPDDPTYKDLEHVDELPDHIVEEITHFFEVYKELEGKKTKVMKFKDREDALETIERSIRAYKEKFSG